MKDRKDEGEKGRKREELRRERMKERKDTGQKG